MTKETVESVFVNVSLVVIHFRQAKFKVWVGFVNKYNTVILRRIIVSLTCFAMRGGFGRLLMNIASDVWAYVALVQFSVSASWRNCV